MNMTPIKIVCFKYESDQYNTNNIGVRSIFGRMFFACNGRRSVKVYKFDPLDPKKLGLTKPE